MGLINIVVIDDSSIFRMILSTAFMDIPRVRIVARGKNGIEALKLIEEHRPHLVTMDVEMPEMDGLTALREIKKLSKTNKVFKDVKVVMLSSITKEGADVTVKALNEGALDCIPKPDSGTMEENRKLLIEHLQRVIDMVRESLALQPKVEGEIKPTLIHTVHPIKEQVFTASKIGWEPASAYGIGISTGGPMALSKVLPELCEKTDLPIFIVQHMPAGFTASLAESLARKCKSQVVEAVAGMEVKNNFVYIAPGGKHIVLEKKGSNIFIKTNEDPPENGCRPAVDVLFRSMADIYGAKMVVAIMTGMGADGAKSLENLAKVGARIIAQDQESSVVWGMPGSAVATGLVNEVVSLDEIPKIMVEKGTKNR